MNKEAIYLRFSKDTLRKIGKTFLKASGNFVFIMGSLYLFMGIFGQSNSLPGVAVLVGILTIPKLDMKMSPLPMGIITVGLFVGSGIIAALTTINLWIAFLGNFLFILLILLLTAEPAALKPYITYLLCFIFCQMSPVEGKDLTLRLLGLATGSVIIVLLSLPSWSRKSGEAHSVKQQLLTCILEHKSFILRMSLGIAVATFIGMLFALPKPIWIGIAVMSLTQFDFEESKQRMKCRVFGTIVGAVLFYLIFVCFIPHNYAFIFIMLLGYIGNFPFAKKYHIQQTINAISALNASLIVVNSSSAIINRLLCLALAILIVILLDLLTRKLKKSHILSFQETNHRLKEYLLSCSIQTERNENIYGDT